MNDVIYEAMGYLRSSWYLVMNDERLVRVMLTDHFFDRLKNSMSIKNEIMDIAGLSDPARAEIATKGDLNKIYGVCVPRDGRLAYCYQDCDLVFTLDLMNHDVVRYMKCDYTLFGLLMFVLDWPYNPISNYLSNTMRWINYQQKQIDLLTDKLAEETANEPPAEPDQAPTDSTETPKEPQAEPVQTGSPEPQSDPQDGPRTDSPESPKEPQDGRPTDSPERSPETSKNEAKRFVKPMGW